MAVLLTDDGISYFAGSGNKEDEESSLKILVVIRANFRHFSNPGKFWRVKFWQPGALIDAHIHLATIDDLHIQFDIVIIISTGNETCTVQSQCTSNSAAIYVHDGLKNLYRYVFHKNWDINSKVISYSGLK